MDPLPTSQPIIAPAAPHDARTPLASHSHRWRGVARLSAAVLIAGALATGVVEHFSTGSPPARAATFTAAAAQAAATTDQAAVQDAITRGNAEQVQALSARDASLMADTSTAAYLQELTQTNQDLSSGGVTTIALMKLEWGPITVSGPSATATTYETWTTTTSDGSVLQSRDENDYTLVQDNGVWKIASDNHPTASSTGASQPDGVAPPPASQATTDLSTSSNWAGYAATAGSYTAVSGTWTVPTYTADTSAGVSATWVGIGGVDTRDLIQAGTQQQTSGSGQTEYQAWIETLPQASKTVPFSVSPGDSVSVSITEQSQNSWLIAFDDTTSGKTYQQSVQYASSTSSAEWIQEAPSAGRGSILPLDNFGTVSFSNASTVKNGKTQTMAKAGATGITMIGGTRQALAVPSSISSDGASFTVSRTANSPTTQASAPARTRRGSFGG